MLNWLKRLFGKGSRSDLYHPSERCIYNFYDGGKIVRIDPMLLYKRLMDKGAELGIDIKVANSPSKGARGAHESMIRSVREIFSVKPLDEGGLTEAETINLLDHFLLYCDEVKKNSSQPPMEPPTSEPCGPSSGGNPPTGNTLPSGFAEGEQTTSSQPTLPSGLPLH